MRRWFLALLPLASAAVLAVGPKVGEQAPPLHLDALNDGEKPAYDAVEAAGDKPLLVVFLSLDAVADERVVGVGVAAEEAYRALHEKGLEAVIVMIGEPALAEDVAEYLKERDVKIPVAVLEPAAEELKAWDLGEHLTNLAVTIKAGRVRQVLADLRMPADADKFKAPLKELMQNR